MNVCKKTCLTTQEKYNALVQWYRRHFNASISIDKHCQMGAESYDICALKYNVITGQIEAITTCNEHFSMPHYVKLFHANVYEWLITYAYSKIL